MSIYKECGDIRLYIYIHVFPARKADEVGGNMGRDVVAQMAHYLNTIEDDSHPLLANKTI